MTQLFWKEWRELRMLPIGACLCVALVIFGMAAFRKSVGDHSPVTTEDTARWPEREHLPLKSAREHCSF